MRHSAMLAALAVSTLAILACSSGPTTVGSSGGGSLCTYSGMEYTTWDYKVDGTSKFTLTFKPDGDLSRATYRGTYDVYDGEWSMSGDTFTGRIGTTDYEFLVLDACSMWGEIRFDGEPDPVPYVGNRLWPACGCE